MRTLLQPTASSSATSIGSAVATPCPISELGIITVTLSSGAMRSQALSVGEADPAGALHLEKERVDGVRHPQQFQPPGGQHAAVDGRAHVIGA